MKLKLNKHSVKMLSQYLEKKMEVECGMSDAPSDSMIAFWIASWAKENMISEAHSIFAEITNDC